MEEQCHRVTSLLTSVQQGCCREDRVRISDELEDTVEIVEDLQAVRGDWLAVC